MIKSKILLLAKTVSIDSLSNQLSIVNVIEELQTPEFPNVLPEATLISLLERSPSDKQIITVKLKAYLNNKLLGSQEFDVDFLTFLRSRSIIKISPFTLKEPGVLKFELFHKNKSLASYECLVRKIDN